MALQIKRCLEETRKSSTTILEDGQPLYATDTNRLYIGDGKTQAKDLVSIASEELELALQQLSEHVTEYTNSHSNLENGEGVNSLIQTTGYGEEYDNYASGAESVALGYGNNVPGKRSFALGNVNIVDGNNAFVQGIENSVDANTIGLIGAYRCRALTRTTSTGTLVKSFRNMMTGESNTIGPNSYYSVVGGMGNYCNGRNNLILGKYNSDSANFPIGAGNKLTTDQEAEWVLEDANTAGLYESCFIIGTRNVPGANNQVIFGSCAQTTSNSTDWHYIHVYGNGGGHATRSNIYAFTSDGRLKLSGIPKDSNDVVRNKELTDTHNTITESIEDLNTTLTTSINTEKDRAVEKETSLQTAIENETIRATGVEGTLRTDLDNEAIRAQGVEKDLQDLIESLTDRVKALETGKANKAAFDYEDGSLVIDLREI